MLIFAACSEKTSDTEADQAATDSLENKLKVPVDDQAFNNGKPMYAWVDNLNVRTEPNLASAVLTQISEGDEVMFSGELSGDSTAVMLRDQAFIDRFAYIRTEDGTTGWVHRSTIREEPPAPPKKLDAAKLPVKLQRLTLEEMEVMEVLGWKEVFTRMGNCVGGGCPLWYTDAQKSFMLIEICDPNEVHEPGFVLMDQAGMQKHYRWWDEEYGINTCHIEGKVSYQVEKLGENNNVKELRIKYDLDPSYGEILLELGDADDPFVLEEKTGSRNR